MRVGRDSTRAATNGTPPPQGCVLDAEGCTTTTNAADLKQGALAPFAGAKGYGLGLALELLAAALACLEPAPNIRGTAPAALPGDQAAARRAQTLTEGFAVETSLWNALNPLGHQSIFEGHVS
ncbi:Ldh family oxidoreductase [Mesorhizobium sp. M1C.F.Ca.ET.187.01.1.1]|uniref:Ldh family oxidoreductase n=1 Tax=unclassified Mesorhizobium TaxID=325217 RepID=UPI0026D94ED6